jgi:Dna[CI] antecedent, DciA
MPKKPPRDKRGKPPMRSRAGLKSKTAHPVHSVKDLLGRAGFTLARVSDQASRQQFWDQWLKSRLGVELHARISGISEQEGKLTVFAESAAWSARLRFAVAEIDTQIRAAATQVTQVSVRVLPRA